MCSPVSFLLLLDGKKKKEKRKKKKEKEKKEEATTRSGSIGKCRNDARQRSGIFPRAVSIITSLSTFCVDLYTSAGPLGLPVTNINAERRTSCAAIRRFGQSVISERCVLASLRRRQNCRTCSGGCGSVWHGQSSVCAGAGRVPRFWSTIIIVTYPDCGPVWRGQ